MTRTLASLLTSAVLAGCVTIADPVPNADGTYRIESAGGSYEDEGYQEAIRYCFEQGKQMVRLETLTADGRPAAPDGQLHFRCVGPGEAGWKEPAG